MSVAAVGAMAVFTLAFFTYAIIYGHRFIQLYVDHVHQWASPNDIGDTPTVLPFLVPMIPATFFSVLGLVTMVTCVRFISSYVNLLNEERQEGSIIERVTREVGDLIRATKGYGDQ